MPEISSDTIVSGGDAGISMLVRLSETAMEARSVAMAVANGAGGVAGAVARAGVGAGAVVEEAFSAV